MLKFNFKRIIRIRRISRPYAFLIGHGFSRNYASKVVNNKLTSIRLQHLEQVCLALKCTPNDLMEWEADDAGIAEESHPLNELSRGDLGKIDDFLQDMPLTELEAAMEYIRERSKK